MKIIYLAHSSFLVITEKGTRVLFDPYNAGCYDGAMRYAAISKPADIVIHSHEHADHSATELPGNPTVISGLELVGTGPRAIGDVTLSAVHTYHDPSQGSERGENAITVLQADGLRLAHLGDLGHPLSDVEVTEIGPVAVIFIPVGGYYTIDAEQAAQVMEDLNPQITIPMHYKTPRVDFPIAPVDDFLKDQPSVRRPGTSELEITAYNLPDTPEIVVLDAGC